MKTFEERYTAWIDGQLAGAELQAFEAELADRSAAEADRKEALQLRRLLREHAVAPPLTGGDFFNYRLLERIEAEDRPAAAPAPRRGFSSWVLPHLAWAGVCSLLISMVIYRTWIAPARVPAAPAIASVPAAAPRSKASAPKRSEIIPVAYDASVIDAQSEDPNVTATPVHSKKDSVTVLWLDGLDYLPSSYPLQ